MIMPQFSGDIEAPGWYARLMMHTATGAEASAENSKRLKAPYISYGRLTGFCWLRLERIGNTFTASVSPDGKTWAKVGQSSIELKDKLYVGLTACSGLKPITTTVKFDNVDVSIDSEDYHMLSPDGIIKVEFTLTDEGRPAYSVDYMNNPIVLQSHLGFEPNFKYVNMHSRILDEVSTIISVTKY